jgi:hypothetical protein
MRKEAAAHTSLSSAAGRPSLIEVVLVEITPEPTEEEREAILQALAAEEAESAPPSPWRVAGLGPADEPQAGAPPRQSRGATRA